MGKPEFRKLKADEIDCRIAMVKEKGVQLLLYKDARVDQNILDETVGPMNWQRRHTRENANCIVSIWDSEKMQWIEKEDTGTVSYTEKEKGLASDSFKRACFNWGIGRELYTAPFIWIKSPDCRVEKKNTAFTCYDKFSVRKIEYDSSSRIKTLEIRNEATRKVVYRLGDHLKPDSEKESQDGVGQEQIESLILELARTGVGKKGLLKNYNVSEIQEMTEKQFKDAMGILSEKPDKGPDPKTVPPDDTCGLPFN